MPNNQWQLTMSGVVDKCVR